MDIINRLERQFDPLYLLPLLFLVSGLHPGLPPWEESAEVFGVHGLLD